MSIKKLVLVLPLVVFVWVYGINAQQDTSDLPPDIVVFSGDRAEVAITDVETGQLTTTLSWHVINNTGEYTLALDQFEGSIWVSVLDEDEVLPSVGDRLVEINPPLNFTPPTYRLTVLDQNQQIVNQRILVIPYIQTDQEPVIESFLTSAKSVGATALEDGTARLTVSWYVTHRLPTSNLIFEQVLADDQAVSVELWRPNVWVSSGGIGEVVPVLPDDDEESVVLRLRVVDVVSGMVYDEAQLTLPIVAEEATPPTATPTAIPASAAINEPQTESATSVEIIAFIAEPNPADPTGTLTLSWEVQGAPQVSISWPTRTASGETDEGVVEEELPPTGTLEVDLADVWYFNSNVASFLLMAEDANGQALLDANDQVISATAQIQLLTDMRIDSFTVNPPTAKRTEALTLAWETTNASKVYIRSRLPEDYDLYDNLDASGELQIVIPEDAYETIGYELVAVDQNGITLKERLEIPVTCSYTPQLSDQCPLIQQETELVYQAYEHGYMIWRGDTQTIYVLYDDGLFESYPDNWDEAEPVQIDETPPGELIKPERGFGKLWLDHSSIREGLGWATTTETLYTTLLEEVSVWIWKRPTREVYFRFPDDRLIHTRNAEIQWEIVE